MGEATTNVEGKPIVSLPTESPSSQLKTSLTEMVRDRLKSLIDANPDLTMSEARKALDVSDQELQTAPLQEYAEYLRSVICESGFPEIAASHIQVIADRFCQDVAKIGIKPYPERQIAHDIGEETRMALWMIAGERDLKIEPEILSKFYSQINSESRTVRFHAFEYLFDLNIIDARNSPEARLNIFDKMCADTVSKLISSDALEIETGFWMVDAFWASAPSYLPDLLISVVEKADSAQALRTAFAILANRIGLEEARAKVRKHANTNPDFKPKLDKLEIALGLDSRGQQIFADLGQLYKDISFENYKPNEEVLLQEVDLLSSSLINARRILDIGCGPAIRHLQVLQQQGKEMVGIDFVPEHVRKAKEISPQANIINANWHSLPFPSGSFDAAYCLGRSFLHNTTVEAGINFLRQAERIIKGGGKLIIDTPDPQKGQYATERRRLTKRTQKLGIDFAESGAIIDSPDQSHFFDRLVPLKKQFVAMARLAGFSPKIIKETEFHGPSGQSNVNLYWELTKEDQKLTFDDYSKLLGLSHTSGPQLYISWV